MNFENLTIINKENTKINLKEINKKVIGLYFSASWCPPCKKFTPILSTFYEDLVEYYDDIEIIYISSDKDQEEFNTYWENMPFPALIYENRKDKEELTKLYNIGKIPSLIFLNINGDIIINNGKDLIQNANGNIEFLRNSLNL